MRLFLVCLPLLLGCSGVFRNPDLVGDAPRAFAPFHRIALPEVSNHEGLLYTQMGDTGVARIPEHDYYWIQGNFLCLLLGFHRPGTECDPLRFSPPQKNITRYEDMDSPPVDLDLFLEPLRKDEMALYALSASPVELIRAIIVSDVPVLIAGTLQYKKRPVKLTRSAYDTGQAPMLLRRVRTLDLIVGYSRMTGLSQNMPGEAGEEILFELRSRRNFKARAGGGLINHALTLYGNAPVGSHWLIERAYLLLPREMDFDALWKRIGETVLKFDYRGPLPIPEKIF